MTKRFRKICAGFLVIALFMSVLPSMEMKALAAGKNTYTSLYWYAMDMDDGATQLNAQLALTEKNLYIGDYIIAYYRTASGTGSSTVLSKLSEATYSSSKKSIATIDKKTGRVTPVATGSTVITASIGDLSLKCKLKIIKSVTIRSEYAQVNKMAKTFISKIGLDGTVTTSNRYSLVNAYNAYLEAKADVDLEYGDQDYIDIYDGVNTTATETNGSFTYKNVIAMPLIRRADFLGTKVESEIANKCPIGTYPAKLFCSTAVKGQNTTVKMTLENSVTASDIFGIKAAMADTWDNYISESSTATFPVYVKDISKNRRYYAIAKATKGSKTLVIEFSTGKMTAGRKYKVDYAYCGSTYVLGDWLKQGKVTFTAK